MLIQIVNDSTVVTPEQAVLWTAACSLQISRDVAPAWEKTSPLITLVTGVPDPAAYQMQIKDDADTPGALGYHDVDSAGKPIGYVFAKTCIAAGTSVSSCLSHELCEMFLDPSCSLWTLADDGKMRALELCDAVEQDSYQIQIGDTSIEVSNFLLPAYFSTSAPGPWDFLKRLTGPAPARTPGGYDIVIGVDGGPSQEFSEQRAALHAARPWKAHPSARTSRRCRK